MMQPSCTVAGAAASTASVMHSTTTTSSGPPCHSSSSSSSSSTHGLFKATALRYQQPQPVAAHETASPSPDATSWAGVQSDRPVRRAGDMKVTLISGFLGSGKTTLLKHILKNKDHKMKTAVIVNEISAFNIDANDVQGSQLVKSEEKLIEMSSGCVCCTLREDLLQQLSELHQSGFDAAIIEASGISEPMQTAQTFFHKFESKFRPAEATEDDAESAKADLMNYAPLDNCVTVVDASRLVEHMSALDAKSRSAQGGSSSGDDAQDLSKLMFEQLEFANVVLLNKIDTIPGTKGEDVESLTRLIRRVNATCEIIPTTHSDVPVQKILGAGNFGPEFLQHVTGGWAEGLDEMKKQGSLTPTTLQSETEEYGVSSMTFTPARPFHPQKLWDWTKRHFVLEEQEPAACGLPQPVAAPKGAENKKTDVEETHAREEMNALVKTTGDARKLRYGNILRSKGYVWLGNPERIPFAASWASAGNSVKFSVSCLWQDFPQLDKSTPATRSQRLVFIGQDLNKKVLEADLSECLLTEEEFSSLPTEDELLSTRRANLPPPYFEDPWKSFFAGPPPTEVEE